MALVDGAVYAPMPALASAPLPASFRLPLGAPRRPADGLPGLGHKKGQGGEADDVWRPTVGAGHPADGPGIDLKALKVDARLTSA